jgi:cephalosporin hydroxylase
MDPREKFKADVLGNIKALGEDHDLKALSRVWIKDSALHNYTYNFRWLGVPIIQLPQDIVAMQELIWQIKPDLVVETGVAHGGSLIMSASMLALLDLEEASRAGEMLDPRKPRRRVLGIDIDVRPHNRATIEAHPLGNRIDLIEGSSVSAEVVTQVQERARSAARVLVFLDSNHTHEHVLAELQAYAPLVTRGSYCVVFDTLIEDRLPGSFPGRPWDKGNNPKTAVWEYLRMLGANTQSGADGEALNFQIDKALEDKLLITVAPDGFLLRL